MSWEEDYQKWRKDTNQPPLEMKSKPEMIRKPFVEELTEQPYERYLPNAFDETLSLVEKVNKVIYTLTQSNQVTNELITKWNEFTQSINDGSLIDSKIDEALQDERLIELINDEIMIDFKKALLDEIALLKGDVDDGSWDNPGSGVDIDGGVW